MKKAVLALVIIGVLVGGYFLFANKTQTPPSISDQNFSIGQDGKSAPGFANPKKSAHYETNTPAHGTTLAAPPVNVVIDFNFDLAKPSSISITKDAKEYGVGETIIDPNKLSMRRDIEPDSPDGIYTVEYKACWPDGSCHDGSFQFAIDRSLLKSSIDMRGETEVNISMKDIAFSPKDILISKGTKVTWTNDDEVEHYVNTDSHPAHTYFKDQNSKALQTGGTYSLVFNTPGAYPYHCSAHADSMSASIVVE